jgi:hypothetical protein
MVREKITSERLQAMQAGIAELQARLLDLVRAGLISMGQKTKERDFVSEYLQEFAARMVDAQLPSLAKRIRSWIAYHDTQPPDWHHYLLREMGALYVFSKAFQKLDSFEEVWQDELLQQAGVTLKRNDLMERQGITDYWLVLGQVETPEVDNLTARRVYLFGKNSRRYILLLDYAFGTQAFAQLWLNGQTYLGEAVFYPSTYPLRAILKSAELAEGFSELISYQSIADLLTGYAEAMSQNLWLPYFPALLDQMTPAFRNTDLYFVDAHQNYVYAAQGTPFGEGAENTYKIWEMLKPSSDKPMSVFGEWTGAEFRPLAAFVAGKYLSLQMETQRKERFWFDEFRN